MTDNIQSSARLNNLPQSSGIDITFQDITYSVEVQKNRDQCKPPCKKEYQIKEILRGITGMAKHGELTAIMGASGAGKTTLLNIIACRIPLNKQVKNEPGVADGKLMANNTEYRYKDFGNFANYVMQEDILLQSLTVRQTLQYVGSLTINQPQHQRKHRIEELAKNLKLEKCIDTLVGGVLLKGVSGGERKRTSIAFQLMTDPQVIVLDQPTSGLDSLTAYIICSYLRRLAKTRNKTVIMTIHQPNSEIFEMFDKLIFMIEGKLVYQGLASVTVNHFNQMGFHCPEFSNPPDYLMSIMHHQSKVNVENYPTYFKAYDQKISKNILNEVQKRSMQPVPQSRGGRPPFCQRLNGILRRDFLNTTRNPLIVRARIAQSIVMGLLVGGVYFGLDTNYQIPEGSQISTNFFTLQGLLFFISMMGFMSSLSPVSIVFPKQRLVFLKEEGQRLYGTGMFVLSRNIVELPYAIIIPLIMQLIFYWMIGLGGTAGQFFTFYFIFFLISLCGSSFGLLLGSMIADAKVVSLLVPVMILPFVLFSGFFKNRDDLPIWLFWLEYLSPLKFSFISFVRNELVQYEDDEYPVSTLNFEEALTTWNSIFILLALALFFRFASVLFLWAKRTKIQ